MAPDATLYIVPDEAALQRVARARKESAVPVAHVPRPWGRHGSSSARWRRSLALDQTSGLLAIRPVIVLSTRARAPSPGSPPFTYKTILMRDLLARWCTLNAVHNTFVSSQRSTPR